MAVTEVVEVVTNPQVVVVNDNPNGIVIEQLAGIRGEIGPRGIAATVNVGQVATGLPDTDASVINSGTDADAILDFTIPQGRGASISVGNVSTGDSGTDAIITNTGTPEDAVLDFVIPQGPRGFQGFDGPQGEAATISLGPITTGDPGTTAKVVNFGTENDAIFNFTIPRGDKGDAATIAVGSTTTSGAGSAALVENSGTANDAVFNFTIPRGDKGEVGDTGPANALAVGTITSVPNGTGPTVTITGNAPSQIINFSLEAGPQGIKGDKGDKGDPGTGSVDSVNGDPGPDVIITTESLGAEPNIAGGTVGQFWQGDKTWQTLNKSAVGLGNVDNTSDLNKPISTATQTALSTKADLVGGLIPTAQLPPLAINDTFPVDSEAAMLALTAQRGDMAIRSDNGRTYILAAEPATTLDNWKEISAASQVTSVAGKTGAIVLDKTDVGLSNVDNTSDLSKPISTATQNALNLKANLASPTFTGTVSGITKTMVGLGNVDNTSDAAKPISTATATALSGKEPTIASGTTTQYLRGDKTWQALDKTAVGLANVANVDTTNAANISSGVIALARIPVAASGTSSATSLVRADDSRLSDSRIPLAHTHNAADINAGTISTARLGTGTANATTFLRGDNTWQVLNVDTIVPTQTDAPTGKADGTFWYDTDDVIDGASNITRVLYNGSWPARPTGAVYVEWVGPVTPTAQITGDTWINTA